MATTLTKRWGDSADRPSADDLAMALAELDTNDHEHPDCWLRDERGWTVSALQRALVIFENVESGDGPWHMRPAMRNEVLEPRRLLDSGKIDDLKPYPWCQGTA